MGARDISSFAAEPPWIATPIGAMTNAITTRQTHNPGRMRSARAATYSRSRGLRTQLAAMRNPEIAKNPSTQTWVNSWSYGGCTFRPVSGQECCRMTPEASTNRHTFSALIRVSKTWASVGPGTRSRAGPAQRW